MDFREILEFKDDQNICIPSEKINIISNKIKSLKNDISSHLRDTDIHIDSIVSNCKETLNESTVLINEISSCKDYIQGEAIQDILNSTSELQEISDNLEETNYNLKIVDQLVVCHEHLNAFQKHKTDNQLYDSVKCLTELTHTLNNPIDGLEVLGLYIVIKTDLVLCWEQLLNDLSDLWNQYLICSEEIEQNGRVVTIEINNNIQRKSDILNALIDSKQINMDIKNFASFLLKKVFDPIIHIDTIVETQSGNTQKCIIRILVNSKTKPYYESVLENLKILFQFLHSNFDYSMPDGSCLLRLLGSVVCNDFSDILIKDCLVHTIPNCISELQDYGQVTSQIEGFQKFLTSISFFENDNFSILQYANNVDVLFANKTSQYFLENARTIMKKDLDIIMSVGTDMSTMNLSPVKNTLTTASTEEYINLFDKCFNSSPFLFPRCAISKSTQEILDLVSVMMDQASQASEFCSKRLYYTARNVFELFIAIVPLHSKALLEGSPQHIALFHNNCMYMSHFLLTLGPRWSKQLQNKEIDYTISFCDQVKELRDLAADKLLNHMRTQRKQILSTIRSSDLNYIATKDILSNNAEEAVRQCLRQLQILKTIWIGIFPPNVYKRLISCLANIFVDELISKVIILEDMDAKVSSQLTDIYSIVIQRLPQIYQNEEEISCNIICWKKFEELRTVLNSSLAEIGERWCDESGRKGPLAEHFKPEEMKQLIRALFQNTSLRSNVLSKIK